MGKKGQIGFVCKSTVQEKPSNVMRIIMSVLKETRCVLMQVIETTHF